MKNDAREQFLVKYRSEKPMYEAWGNYVQRYIYEKIKEENEDISKLIKLKCEPRVKNEESIIAKAFFRKSYKDPYREITDKVGIRFVVMVDKQIKIIKDIVENASIWFFSKDNDYEEAIATRPEYFSYQSVHYIVRNRNEVDEGGIIIKKGTPCEIQIRTLEQHAYAELSHDYLYKKKEPNACIKRYMARSMALNETTDELFGKVYELMENEEEKYYLLVEFLKSLFNFESYSEKIDKSIFECIESMINEYVTEEKIKDFLNEYIINRIKERQNYVIYQQPMIIILYYLARSHYTELEQKWCFTPDMLVPIFSDCGISSNDDY